MTLGKITIRQNDIQYNNSNALMACAYYSKCRDFACYAECRYAECRYGECHVFNCNAKCRYAECRGAVFIPPLFLFIPTAVANNKYENGKFD